MVQGLQNTIVSMQKVIDEKDAQLAKYENPKTSKNSSIPPSKDENRKNQSTRGKTNKKIGGQHGHKGTTMSMVDTPDVILDHKPLVCISCGERLESGDYELNGRRQVKDMMPIVIINTEHRVYRTACKCGLINCGMYPSEATNNVSYGKNIEVFVNYLSARQYMPTNRIKEFFTQVCKMPISEGTVCNMISRFAERLEPTYEKIREQLSQEKYVGVDETGCKINGKKNWAWICQSVIYTYIFIHVNRGYEAAKEGIGDRLQNCILVHDCWKTLFKIPAKMRQICLAHLLRELQYFIELGKETWSKSMMELLLQSIDQKKRIDYTKQDNYKPAVSKLKNRLSYLLDNPPENIEKELQTFHKRLIKYKDYILPFLDHEHLPYDNNGSERGIRNFKVKLKVSTQFKSEKGAKAFAIIRSVIDTAIKSNQNIFDYFHTLAA
jgi:transposase